MTCRVLAMTNHYDHDYIFISVYVYFDNGRRIDVLVRPMYFRFSVKKMSKKEFAA